MQTAFDKLSSASVLGCDTETSGLGARTGRLFSVQFSDGEFNVLVPVSEGIELGLFAAILTDPAIVKIFHNAKFDLDDDVDQDDFGVWQKCFSGDGIPGRPNCAD